MTEIKWIACEDKVPLKDGNYLAITSYRNQGKIRMAEVNQMNYVADTKGGWNCTRTLMGEIRNDYRIDSVIAWCDCINDIEEDVQKEVIDRWYS